ncbi:MAG: NAD(P)-binding protein [Gammaproteobacteria bacterium]|nr:NAD(P)-binding protein [Gammaproteobacteria bacterium]
MASTPSVAIIGAGLAGLTCGAALKGLGPDIRIFEKSIFPGGRLSLFRAGDYEFNYGAQYFTVSNPLFQSIVSAWQVDGVVRPWEGWIVELHRGQINNCDMTTQRFVGYPRMQTITETLAENCDVQYSSSICEMERQSGGGWRLFNERGDYLGAYDVVILATAANDTKTLGSQVPEIKQFAESVEMTVCWSGMFAFEDKLDLPYDAAFVLESPLFWVSRYQMAEPKTDADSWVLQASPEWSQQYVASYRGRVMHALLDAFWEAAGIDAQKPVSASVHCWKHAAPINPIGQDSLFVAKDGIGACGDWCTSPRVEGAVLSGFSMADRVMKHFGQCG